jgi:hypothetical protein
MIKKYRLPLIITLLTLAILSIMYRVFTNNLTPPVVIDHLPTNKALFVLNNQKIIIRFDRNLRNSQKKHLQLITSPKHEFTVNWSDNQTVEYIPSTPFITNEEYRIGLLFDKTPILDSSFKTNKYTEVELFDQKNQQIEDDFSYAQTRNEFYQENPWKTQLPIKEAGFTITYNEATEKFRLIIPEKVSTNTLNEYRLLMAARLLEIGVPQEKIDFVVINLSETNR